METDAADRPSFAAYPGWLQKHHGVTVDRRLQNRYETAARWIQRDFADSVLWKECLRDLDEFDADYQVSYGYALLDRTEEPTLVTKPFSSFILKTYRKNILDNPSWPDPPPKTGWLVPLVCLPAINDVVRTVLVVRYLDGVQFLVDKLKTVADRHKAEFRSDLEAREEGYYAAHAYFISEFEVPAEMWDTERVDASIELQVTTQVQALIRRLLHTYYEERRGRPPSAGKWQWDYTSEEFGANYLGHILHYVEGMIMDIREKQTAGGTKS